MSLPVRDPRGARSGHLPRRRRPARRWTASASTSPGRGAGAGRRKRLGQERHAQGDHAAGASAGPGHRPGRLAGRRPAGGARRPAAPDPRRRDRDDLSGADERAEPGAAGGVADRRKPSRPYRARPRRAPRPGARADGSGRHPRRGAAAGGLSAPVLGRDAAAGDDRHRAGRRAEAAAGGRADHGAGRHHPGPDPDADPVPARRAGHVGGPGHPRSRRRRRHLRPGGGDVCRAHRRDRAGGRGAAPGRGMPIRSA